MPTNTIKASPQVGGFQVRSSLRLPGLMYEVHGAKNILAEGAVNGRIKMCCAWAWKEISVTRIA